MEEKIILSPDQYEDICEYQDDYDDVMYKMLTEKNMCVMTGYFMAWDGKKEGGFVAVNLGNAVAKALLGGTEPIFKFDENGVFTVVETHHDAPVNGNVYKFRILTKKGKAFYEENSSEMGRRSLCETLFKSDEYSRNVDLSIFGI